MMGKRIVKLATEEDAPQQTERIVKLMAAITEAVLPYDPSVNELLSAFNTL